MDLTQLKAKGAFVTTDAALEPIVWTHRTPDGTELTDTFDVHVLRVSFGVLERAGKQENSASALIAACVRFGEDGDEAMTYEEACALDPGLAAKLVEAVNRVNRVGDKEEDEDEGKD